MKNKLALCFFAAFASLSLISSVSAQSLGPGAFSTLNVGDGTGSTTGNGTFVAEGKFNVSPILGSAYQTTGSRMLWYARKSAFRAGYGDTLAWSEATMGPYSVAMGYLNKASGYGSTALGYYGNIASGYGSTAMGYYQNTASGNYSTAMGYFNIASGDGSTAMGYNNTASGFASMAMGVSTTASTFGETVIGSYNASIAGSQLAWNLNDPVFQIGNGHWALYETDYQIDLNGNGVIDQDYTEYLPETRSNALTVYKNGNMNLMGSLTLGGAITSAGSPVLTTASASDVYANIAALPKYGVSGTNFDRANGSAAFGNSSYALGINNFSGGASRIGRDNGQSYPGSGTSSNATNPIPFTNFKNNAAFGTSIIGHTFSSWSASSFKGTEKLENNLTTGTSKLAVSAGAQIINTTATGNSSLVIQPSSYSTSPSTGTSLFGNSSGTIFGNGRISNSILSGSSSLNIWQETSSTTGTNVGSADNSAIFGGSSLAMTNQGTSSNPNSDYVTLSGKSRSLALSNRSTTYSSAFGQSMIYTGDYSFNDQGFGPGFYFPGTSRWNSVFPRMATTHAFAAGESVVANGTHGTALGKARVYADYGTAIGEGVDAGTAGTVVVGRYNKLQQYAYSPNDEGAMQQFVIGNGSGDLDTQRSNALVVERSGRSTLTNKTWKANSNAIPTPANSYAQALVVEGHTVLNGDTRLEGKVIISVPQGDISMGIYQ